MGGSTAQAMNMEADAADVDQVRCDLLGLDYWC